MELIIGITILAVIRIMNHPDKHAATIIRP